MFGEWIELVNWKERRALVNSRTFWSDSLVLEKS